MEPQDNIRTAAVLANITEIAAGIVRKLDGNAVSSKAGGPRNIEQDVAVAINRKVNKVNVVSPVTDLASKPYATVTEDANPATPEGENQ